VAKKKEHNKTICSKVGKTKLLKNVLRYNNTIACLSTIIPPSSSYLAIKKGHISGIISRECRAK
jgi:hypothetical protein